MRYLRWWAVAALLAGSGCTTSAAPSAVAAGGAQADAGADGGASFVDGFQDLLGGTDGTAATAADGDAAWTDAPSDLAAGSDAANPAVDADTGETAPGAAADAGQDSSAEAGAAADTDTAAADTAVADAAAADAGPAEPQGPTWDLAAVADPATAACSFTGEHTVLKGLTQVKAYSVSYLSWESQGGKLKPILIRGFAARPAAGSGKLPGVVLAHGLGGHSTEASAVELAARLGYFVVAYTGPGGGDSPANTSEGKAASADSGYRMFDTLVDIRGSWFWGHTTAAMRAVTCLGTRGDVDPTKLGITGFSAGGVASLLVAGHDPRVVAAVPMSGTLAWDVATQAPKAWQHSLLQKAGLSIASPEWQKLMEGLIQPAAALAGAKAKVLMLNGTTDEFFPLTAHKATFDALPGGDKRTSLAGNFDHGCYQVSGGEPKAEIENRAKLRAEGGQKMWFGKWFGSAQFAYVPVAPQVSAQPVGAATLISAVVDPGGSQLQVEEVRAWASGDNAFFFASATLDAGKGGLWSKLVPIALPANAVWFVDVQYKTKSLLPDRFSISSPPTVAAGLIPAIRGIDNCL